MLVLLVAVLLAAAVRSAGAAEGWVVREQPGTLQYRLPASADWSRAAPGTPNCRPARPCAPAADGLPCSLRPTAAS
jgi:hypothetical protein